MKPYSAVVSGLLCVNLPARKEREISSRLGMQIKYAIVSLESMCVRYKNTYSDTNPWPI